MQRFKIQILTALALLSLGTTDAQTIQLYHSVRGSGVVQELDQVTGNVIATNVGGITGGRGMAFSPLGGLYIAGDFEVIRLNTAASTPSTAVNIPGEIAHDVNFDLLGNMYVVTNLNVRVYDIGLSPTLTFAHNMTTTTGDGNPNKGFGIAVNPTNGLIYVVAAQGIRRFDPGTGLQVGPTIPGTPNGMAGIAFTTSGFNGARYYVGNVISGIDQILAYDASDNLLRSFFPTHNGNPIDLEVDQAGNLYLFNTVFTNPANRYMANETLYTTFSSGSRPSQGSALGDFDGVALQEEPMGLRGEAIGARVYLHWTQNLNIEEEFEVQRFGKGHWRTITTSKTQFAWDNWPETGTNLYRVAARDEQGQRRYSSTLELELTALEPCQVWQDESREQLHIRLNSDQEGFRFQLLEMTGRVVLDQQQEGRQADLATNLWPKGLYLVRIQGKQGRSDWVQKIVLRSN